MRCLPLYISEAASSAQRHHARSAHNLPKANIIQKTSFAFAKEVFCGGRYRTRTCDPPHVKRMLIPAELIVRSKQGVLYPSKYPLSTYFPRKMIFLRSGGGGGVDEGIPFQVVRVVGVRVVEVLGEIRGLEGGDVHRDVVLQSAAFGDDSGVDRAVG